MNAAKGLGISAAIVGASALLLRGCVSRKWLDYRSRGPKDGDDPLLSGRVYVVTGGNTGLGYETALDLAGRGATVVIACRDMEKGYVAMEKIMKATGNPDVDCLELDLASLGSVRSFVGTIQNHPQYSTVTALILNAGVWVPPPPAKGAGAGAGGDADDEDDDEEEPLASSSSSAHRTRDGFEIHFGVNHLGHHLLATSLLENVKRSGDGRIVFVTSSLLKNGRMNFEAHDHIYKSRVPAFGAGEKGGKGGSSSSSFAPPPAYCDSKLFNALACKQLATTLPDEVTTYSVCPGFCRTELGRSVPVGVAGRILLAPVLLLVQRTARQGAQNVVFAALESKENLKSGACYADGDIAVRPTRRIDSFGMGGPKALWAVSEMLVKADADAEQ